MFNDAMTDNVGQIAAILREEAEHRSAPMDVADLGCWDGVTASRYIPANSRVTGVEVSSEAARKLSALSWQHVQADLNGPLPLENDSFDAISSNQVIEHLYDTDKFMEEAMRILRPGGILVVSTENLSSWHNIFSLVLGWQAFSLSNVSRHRSGLGNPLSNLRGAPKPEEGWYHQRIFSYRGLAELAECVGLENVNVVGAGYYPFPTRFAHLDPRHAAFITVTGRKPRDGAVPGG
jgi:SAM-dependent methyltransferase